MTEEIPFPEEKNKKQKTKKKNHTHKNSHVLRQCVFLFFHQFTDPLSTQPHPNYFLYMMCFKSQSCKQIYCFLRKWALSMQNWGEMGAGLVEGTSGSFYYLEVQESPNIALHNFFCHILFNKGCQGQFSGRHNWIHMKDANPCSFWNNHLSGES